MPPIWCNTKFRGEEGEIETEALLNSGSDLVVLPKSLAQKIEPKLKGEVEVELADGRSVWRKAYEIEIEVINNESGEKRKTRIYVTVEKRDFPLIGTEAMEKLRIIPDVVNGKVSFV